MNKLLFDTSINHSLFNADTNIEMINDIKKIKASIGMGEKIKLYSIFNELNGTDISSLEELDNDQLKKLYDHVVEMYDRFVAVSTQAYANKNPDKYNSDLLIHLQEKFGVNNEIIRLLTLKGEGNSDKIDYGMKKQKRKVGLLLIKEHLSVDKFRK